MCAVRTIASVAACVVTSAIVFAFFGLWSRSTRSEPRASRSTAIVGVSIVDPTNGDVREDQSIVIERGRIARLGASADVHVDGRAFVVDGHGKWAIPGLVDAHVHFFQSGSPYARPDIIDLRGQLPYRQELERTRSRISMTLRRWLASGVTAVADLGGPMWTFEVPMPATSVRSTAQDTFARSRCSRKQDSRPRRSCVRPRRTERK